MRIQDTQAVPAYFCGNPARGRTTQLVSKETGEVLFEAMGICSRRDLWNGWEHQKALDARLSAELNAGTHSL